MALHWSFRAAFLTCIFSWAASAAASNIDTFDVGPFSLVASGASSSSAPVAQRIVDSLDPGEVIGGARAVAIYDPMYLAQHPQDSVTVAVESPAGVMNVTLDLAQDPGIGLRPSAIVSWGFWIDGNDLNADWSRMDRITLTFIAGQGPAKAQSMGLWLYSNHVGISWTEEAVFWTIPNGATSNEVLLAEFGSVDLADIDGVAVGFMNLRPDQSFSLDSITVTPEPATLCLLALGGLAIAGSTAGRRKKAK